MMNRSTRYLMAILLALPGCDVRTGEQSARTIASPDGRVAITVASDRDGGLYYDIRHDGRPLIARSPIGLTLDGAAGTFGRLRIGSVERASVKGKRAYTGMLIRAAETSGAHRRLNVELRAYDGGITFRLVLPGPAAGITRIRAETTRFVFPHNELCLAVHQKELVNSHEGEYAPAAASQLQQDGYYDLPLVCRTGRADETFAITESGIENFTAAYLVALPRNAGASTPVGVAIKLTPRHDDASLAVIARVPITGLKTPWRLVMVADRPQALTASTLVEDLAPPSVIGDSSWVRPGKATWAWWSGMIAPGVPHPGHNDATYRRYIDFAARFGAPYYLIDRGWAWRDPDASDPIADVMRTTGGVDIPALVDYARRRGVRLWLWVNWKALDPKMDAALALYQRLGIAGIKVDYLDRQDQEMVAFYHRLLRGAARHRLMVDIHAAFVPRGLDRTYPNFVSQEGVMGTEYNRWSRRVTASHDVELAYARAIVGPMDYAPGAFRNVTPAAFRPRNHAPEVMTSRAHQLALAIAYPSPFLVLADEPRAYRNADSSWATGAEVLRTVPTIWDATAGIAGSFGRWIATARRRHDDWYIGVLNDEQARTVDLPLDFLKDGRWEVASWTDGQGPADVVRRGGIVTADPHRRLIVPLASGGGAVLRFRPVRASASR